MPQLLVVGAGFSVCGSAAGFGCAWSNPVVSGSGSVLGGVIFLLESIYTMQLGIMVDCQLFRRFCVLVTFILR